MASIQDVADQINARLDLIATSTSDTAQNTANNVAVSESIRDQLIEVNNRISQLDARLATGFANLSQGLFAILEVQRAALILLDHHRRQNDTIICELVNNNELLCTIMRRSGEQVRLLETSTTSIQRIEGILEFTHCAEAAEYDRHREVIRRVEECCPPKPIPKEDCPDSCETPVHRAPDPAGQEWEPLPTPDRRTPVG